MYCPLNTRFQKHSEVLEVVCVCVFSMGSDKWFLVLSLLLKAWVDEAADPRGCYLGSAGIGKVPAVSSSQKIEWGRAERAGVALLWVRWCEGDPDHYPPPDTQNFINSRGFTAGRLKAKAGAATSFVSDECAGRVMNKRWTIRCVKQQQDQAVLLWDRCTVINIVSNSKLLAR